MLKRCSHNASIRQSQQNVAEPTFNTQQLDELKTLMMPIQLLKQILTFVEGLTKDQIPQRSFSPLSY